MNSQQRMAMAMRHQIPDRVPVMPYERKVTDAVKATGVPIYTHTCGSIGDRLDLMLQTGTQGIDTLDPPPLGNTELAAAKQQIGDKVFIKGNMNSVELMRFTQPQEVIEHATKRIVTGMPGGDTFSARPARLRQRLRRGNWNCSLRWRKRLGAMEASKSRLTGFCIAGIVFANALNPMVSIHD